MEELEIMRRQLASMKEQLRSQHIVNESLLRKVMKGKASWMNTFVKAEIICLPIIWLLFVAICAFYGISQWYASLFLILSVIDTALDWSTVRIPPRYFGTLSMLELKKFLLRQKRRRFVQMCIMAPLAVIWIVAFLYEMVVRNIPLTDGVDPSLKELTMIGGAVGGIIGAVIGVIATVVIYKRMQRTNDTIISDINDVEAEA